MAELAPPRSVGESPQALAEPASVLRGVAPAPVALAAPGRFMRASEPRPSTSCSGTIAVSATETKSVRTKSQWTSLPSPPTWRARARARLPPGCASSPHSRAPPVRDRVVVVRPGDDLRFDSCAAGNRSRPRRFRTRTVDRCPAGRARQQCPDPGVITPGPATISRSPSASARSEERAPGLHRAVDRRPAARHLPVRLKPRKWSSRTTSTQPKVARIRSIHHAAGASERVQR